jgi:hypothetical protein
MFYQNFQKQFFIYYLKNVITILFYIKVTFLSDICKKIIQLNLPCVTVHGNIETGSCKTDGCYMQV